MPRKIYHAEIVAGSLLVNESRKIADLLIEGLDEKAMYERITLGNVLQKRSPASAKRQAKLIRNRLGALDKDFWIIIRDGSHEQATQAALVAAIAHSRIVGDFIRQVIGLKVRTFQKHISFADWNNFFEESEHRDPHISSWSESTAMKIRQVVFRILAEANIIESTRSMLITPFLLLPEIKELLEVHGETYALGCLESLQ